MAKAKSDATPENTQETTQEAATQETSIVKFTTVELKASVDLLVAPQRLDPAAKTLKTGVTLEIPAGGAAIFSLSERLIKSPLRLVTSVVLNTTEEVLKYDANILVDNLGPDGFFVREDTALANCVIVSAN